MVRLWTVLSFAAVLMIMMVLETVLSAALR
jgi:hypothetical protein